MPVNPVLNRVTATITKNKFLNSQMHNVNKNYDLNYLMIFVSV